MTSPWQNARRSRTAAVVAVGLLALAAPARAQTHLDNPFAGARMYVNPAFTANADATAAATADPTLAAAMRRVGRQPTAVWIERIAAVPTVATHLDRALAAGDDLVLFVLRNLPGRDCSALQYDGELPIDGGLARYRAEFIDPIVAIAGDPRYAGLRIVFVVEPDSLVNLVTGLSTPICAMVQSSGLFVEGVRYAVNELHELPNVYLYLDLAYSGWLGWTENAARMVSLLDSVSSGFTAGKSAIDGFATNTAQYVPVKEPWLSADQVVAGQQVWTATFYEYNRDIDEASFVADMYGRLVAAGWPGSIGMIVDTSRNGWGGPQRPSGPSAQALGLERFVDESRVDRRAHRGLWCNVAGAGVGERPQATPPTFAATWLDAFVWVKTPGESDGASSLAPEGPPFDRECDPEGTTSWGIPTGALSGAPPRGSWFPAQFTELVQNRWPEEQPGTGVPLEVTLDQSGICNPPPGCDPGEMCAAVCYGGSAVTSSPAGISCGPSGGSCSAAFAGGTSVVLTAIPNPNTLNRFAGWIGACSGTAPTCVVQMTQPRSVTARFVADVNYALSVTRAGTGAGTVTGAGGAVDCGATCNALFSAGVTVTLTAAASAGSAFTGWSGACAGTATTCAVRMDRAQAVTATFTSLRTYPLTVTRSGTGAGTVVSSPAGIQCGATCSALFGADAVVTLYATPAGGSAFHGWSGACAGYQSACVLTMSSAREATAIFLSGLPQLTIVKSGTGAGTVTSSPAGIDCGATCTARFAYGAAVTLNVVPAQGSRVVSVTGCTDGGSCSGPIEMTNSRTVTVVFEAEPTIPLTVTRSGTGAGTVVSSPAGIQCGATCSALFGADAVVTLYATPAGGSAFHGWSGACAGYQSACVLTMSSAREATAIFLSGLPQLTIVKSGTGAGTVTSSPAGIDCGATCTARFAYGAAVTLNVVPAQGSRVVSVTGCTDGGSCSGPIEMTNSRTVTVVFEAEPATAPCADAIPFSWNTGNFGAVGAVCYRTSQRVNGWGCSNFGGRTVRVNGGAATATCGAGPFPLAKHADGFTYFAVTAGQYPWASIYVW